MNIYSNNSWKIVVEMLKSDIYRGLSEEECETRRKENGDNSVFVPYKKGIVALLRNFIYLHMFISIAITSFLFYRKEQVMAIISLIILLLSLIIKIVYENKKFKKLNFLQNVNNTTTRVIRNGTEKVVKAKELVKGDIVNFSKGSLIAADIRIISAKDIKVDETNITGERFFKEKFDSKINDSIYSITEMKNMLFKGSLIKEGEGCGIVVETGNATELGKMLTLMMYVNNNKHTLGKRLEKRLGKLMTIFTIISVLFFIGTRNLEVLQVSLFIVSSIPFIIIALLYCFILKRVLKDEGIDLINISSLDLIKNIEIFFMDKVGSISEDKMTVEKLYVNNKIYSKEEITYDKEITIKRLIEIMVLCNNAIYNGNTEEGKGELFEVAALKFGSSKQVQKSLLEQQNRRLFEIPMDTDKRMLTIINKNKKGCRANCRGNVDAVLNRCSHIMINGLAKEITSEDITRIKAIDYNLSLEGLTSQAVAYRSFSYTPSKGENIENNLVFVGLVAVDNPLTDNAEECINELKNRGIIPIVFTDDNKITASSLARKIKLASANTNIITAVEMYSLGKEEIINIISKTRVFSKITPELKARIIGVFNKDNYKVACSGESLGDLPSICLSYLGISKGNSPEIINNASDIHIEGNYLKGFLRIYDLAKEFTYGIKNIEKAIIILLISEMALINVYPLINNGGIISSNIVAIINLLISVPLLISLVYAPKKAQGNILIKSIAYTLLLLGVVYNVDASLASHISLIVLGGIITIYTLFNSKFSIRKININTTLTLLSIILLLIIFAVNIFINNISMDYIIGMKIAGALIITFIIELFSGKWQE